MIGADFAEVLLAAQAKDVAAVERLYLDLAPTVLGYLRASGANEPDDLASDVFVAVIRGLPRFEGPEVRFRSWVMTIAHHRLVDDFRRRARRPIHELPTDDQANALVDPSDVASEALTRLESSGVLDALEHLTIEQRSVLYLRLVADMRVSQVAEIMGKPETAVKALQRRAIERTKRLLAGPKVPRDPDPGPAGSSG